MGIKNSTILTTPTISASGGTSSTLKSTGVEIPGGVQVTDTSIADFSIRPIINFKYRPPKLTNGVYSKAKHDVVIITPELVNDVMVFPLIRIGYEPHPMGSAANKAKLLAWASQILFDTDYVDFLDRGSMD